LIEGFMRISREENDTLFSRIMGCERDHDLPLHRLPKFVGEANFVPNKIVGGCDIVRRFMGCPKG